MHPKTNMFGAILFAALLVSPARGEVRIGYGVAGNIARQPDIPGKNIRGDCLPFARELHARLQAANIRSAVIVYAYEGNARLAAPLDTALSHAVVVYEDHGRTYIMDNQTPAPIWVPDATATEMAQRFSGPAVAVRGALVDTDLDVLHIAASPRRHHHRHATARTMPPKTSKRLADR